MDEILRITKLTNNNVQLAEYERERDNLQTELALLERRLTELEDHHAAKEQELASR